MDSLKNVSSCKMNVAPIKRVKIIKRNEQSLEIGELLSQLGMRSAAHKKK
jgi:hypothetical protein